MPGLAISSADVVAVPVEAHALTATSQGAPLIHKHDRVIVTVVLGAAHIDRQAVALQAAREGQMLFVRTDDGDVLSVRAEKAP